MVSGSHHQPPPAPADGQEPVADPWRAWARHLLPCYVRPEGGELSQTLHLDVTTCAIVQELDVPALPKAPGKPYWVCDFGALPVGERAVKIFEIANNGASASPPARLLASLFRRPSLASPRLACAQRSPQPRSPPPALLLPPL